MIARLTCGAAVGLLSCALATVADGAVFRSTRGFTVTYPRSWIRAENPEELDLLSTKHTVEGVVIPHGGAGILVSEISLRSGETLPKFLHRRYDVDVISQRHVPLRRSGNLRCHSLERVDATFEIAPDRNGVQHQTFFACVIQGRWFLTSLTRWESDHANPQWERTALKIAASLKINSVPTPALRSRY